MKKSIISLVILIIVLLMGTVISSAVEITLTAPMESEIMPTRDFYVIGEIDREGKSAREEPVNIKIELIDKTGKTVRSLMSNVSPIGLTDATYFMLDYEEGSSYNDPKGAFINSLTPPDVLYDGLDRDSIRLPHTKIVVKENYFAAIIFGGATKNIDLRYTDEYENPLFDLTEGKYELVVTALNQDGEEVSTCRTFIIMGNAKDRLIAQNINPDYVKENSLAWSNSIVGYWKPGRYIKNIKNDFSYVSRSRLLTNLLTEYGLSKNIKILLKDLDTKDTNVNLMLGSAFSDESSANISFLYYDIGEEELNFNLSGTELKKVGEIIESKNDTFLQIYRAECSGDVENQTYMDFDMTDGVIISEKSGTTFYGVYSPLIASAKLSSGSYLINDMVSRIKVSIVDENGNPVYEDTSLTTLVDEDADTADKFEFKFHIVPNKEMINAKNLTLRFYAVDANDNELLTSENISSKVNRRGYFVAGYEDNYWGKIFCDTLNDLGRSPSGEAVFPDTSIKRGDFAAMVNHLLGYGLYGESSFTDLDEDSIYYSDCVTAQLVGYMTGDEKGNINADDLISREQAMIILARISGAEKGEKEIEFKDRDKISFWAKDYVDAMCATGIVSGFDGYINPTDNITVAEAAALIIKTVKWMYSDDEVLPTDIGNNFTPTENINTKVSFDEIKITDIEVVEKLSDEAALDFFKDNIQAFVSISVYLQNNHTEGVSIKKVGNGLDIRDYKTGNIVKLSEESVDLITRLCSSLVTFSIKYNPNNNGIMYFKLGVNKSDREIGIAYAENPKANGKIFEELTENWYFYSQE